MADIEGALRDAAAARDAAAIVAVQTAERFLAIQTSIVSLERDVARWREAQDRYNALADALDMRQVSVNV